MSRINRKSQRIEITLDAKVSNAFSESTAMVRNFCQGGLFMEYAGMQGGNGAWQPRRGERVRIDFDVPADQGYDHFELNSRVAHLGPTGFGVTYDRPELEAWYALMRLRKRSVGDKGAAPAKVQRKSVDQTLITELRLRTLQALREPAQQASKTLLKALQEAAHKARNQIDQGDYFYALDVFQANGSGLMEKWLERVAQRIDALAGPKGGRWGRPKEHKDDDFQLVDKAHFDEWVMVAGLASKIEGDVGSLLYELEQRLSVLALREINQESNPIGPSALLTSFEEVLEPFALTPLPKKLVYKVLEKRVLNKLEPLYQEVNRILQDNGVLPDIKKKAVKQAAAKRAAAKEKALAEKPPASGAEAAAPGGSRSSKRSMLGSLYNLFRPPQKAVAEPSGDAAAEPQAPAAQAPEAAEDGPVYDVDRVVEILSKGGGDPSLPLEQRLEAALIQDGRQRGEARPGRLSDEVKGAIGATAGLVDSIRGDASLNAEIRSTVGRLETPLVKAALQNPEAFSDPQNPAVNILNSLEKLSVALASEDPDGAEARQLKSAIQSMVDTLDESNDVSPESFARAHQVVAPMVEKYQQMFAANARRLAETQRGQSRLSYSKRRVKEVISERIADREAPKVVLEFIKLGWDSLLIQAHLRDGEDSRRWKTSLTVLDRLIRWLDPQASFPPAKPQAVAQVLAVMEKGYAAIPTNPSKQQRLLKVLRLALTKDRELFDRLRQSRRKVRNQDTLIIPEAAAKKPPTQQEQSLYDQWRGTIDGISIGDWLVQRKGGKTTRPISLAFVSEHDDEFLFVDGKGAKALSCDPYELADLLERNGVFILEDGGLPLVQRAVQRVLKDTYEKMLENAETDALTGLMNRRAFTKKLEHSLKRIKNEGGQDAVLVIDIDRFKVVNDICGYEGGDRLLVSITHILQTYLDPNATLSRVGDDEYGVLISHCGREAGFEIAETQRRAIENYVFNWDGRRLPISASVGMVLITELDRSASGLLQDADSASYLAKKAGRNRTKVYESNDEDVKRQQGEVKAVTLVEDAIQNGRLQLFLQRISPLFFDADQSDQFEILLRMLDRNDKLVAPDEFLRAAEGYNRMRTLDRWVIEHLFGWLEHHHERLEAAGGFCINLSSQSLSDVGIQELIAEKLENSAFPAEKIAFEISESALTKDYEQATKLIHKLQFLGCRFDLDDFGSGVASYAYLKDVPVTRVKIDGNLIRNIADDENNYALVKSITEVCHFMKKQVVAEAVENEGIIVKLRELDVDYIQGYAVGHPFPLSKLLEQI